MNLFGFLLSSFPHQDTKYAICIKPLLSNLEGVSAGVWIILRTKLVFTFMMHVHILFYVVLFTGRIAWNLTVFFVNRHKIQKTNHRLFQNIISLDDLHSSISIDPVRAHKV